MTDVYAYLSGVVERVEEALMPTELDTVAQFLRGDAWVATLKAPSVAPGSSSAADHTHSTSADPCSIHVPSPTLSSSFFSAPTAVTTVKAPDGLVAWHEFIPLVIAANTLMSVTTSGGRSALSEYFSSSGFARVLSVNLIAAELGGSEKDQSCVASTAVAAAAGAAVEGPSKILQTVGGDTVLAARHGCVDAVRAWCADVEAGAREWTALQEAGVRATDEKGRQKAEQLKRMEGRQGRRITCGGGGARRKRSRGTERDHAELHNVTARHPQGEHADAARPVHTVRRLLLLVRCTSDNRATLSSSGHAGAAGSAGRKRKVEAASGGTSGGGTRKLRHGADPLYLFLHDITAVCALYRARLRRTGWHAHVAVLLLPADHAYGAAHLERGILASLGHRYSVRLYTQDADTNMEQFNRGSNSTAIDPAASPLEKARRLAVLWSPHLFSLLEPEGNQTDDSSTCTDKKRLDSKTSTNVQQQKQLLWENTLLRDPELVFLRPSNLPLCCFLRESLRRFPVIVTPAILQTLKVAWTARHSTEDMLIAMHAVLMPFSVSSSWAESSGDSCGVGDSNHTDHDSSIEKENGDGSGSCMDGAAGVDRVGSDEVQLTSRVRTSALSFHHDSMDIIEALLVASSAWSAQVEESMGAGGSVSIAPRSTSASASVLFCLLYSDLVYRRGMRLLRVPGVAGALAAIYDRERRSVIAVPVGDMDGSRALRGCAIAGGGGGPVHVRTEGEKAAHTLEYLVPFYEVAMSSSVFLPTGTQLDQQADTTSALNAVSTVPAWMCMSNMFTTVSSQLQRSVLLALLQPHDSLVELSRAAATSGQLLRARMQALQQEHPLQSLPDGSIQESLSVDSHDLPAMLSMNNFYSSLIPDSVRVLYLLTTHALICRTSAEKHVPLVQLQQVCQVGDEELIVALRELQLAGLISLNLRAQTARTLLDM